MAAVITTIISLQFPSITAASPPPLRQKDSNLPCPLAGGGGWVTPSARRLGEPRCLAVSVHPNRRLGPACVDAANNAAPRHHVTDATDASGAGPGGGWTAWTQVGESTR